MLVANPGGRGERICGPGAVEVGNLRVWDCMLCLSDCMPRGRMPTAPVGWYPSREVDTWRGRLTWVAGETAASDCTRQITRLHSAREAGRSRSGVTTTGACNMCVGARRQVERVGVQGHAVWGEGFLEGCFARGGDEGGKGRPHETVSVMFVYGVRCAEPLCSGA